MAYKYQYNPAAVDNVSLHEKGRAKGGTLQRDRHRVPEEDDNGSMSGGIRCCFGLLTLVAQVLLHGVLALTLYWVVQYRWGTGDSSLPFSWRGDQPGDLERQWNLHPVLMIAGFIYFTGQAMLVFRSCRCCRRLWSKLIHTMFHLLAIPCITVGFLAAWDYHSLRKDKEGNPAPLPHFYSIHSWLGLATMGLYVLQFLVGVFSFLLLLCCESATARFRAGLVPIHSTFGTTTFLLAIATAVAGLTEKAFIELSITYPAWVPYLHGTPASQLPSLGPDPYSEHQFQQAVVLNSLAAGLALLGVLLPVLLWCPRFRTQRPP